MAIAALLVGPPAVHAAGPQPTRGRAIRIPLQRSLVQTTKKLTLQTRINRKTAHPTTAHTLKSAVEKAALEIPDLKSVENVETVTAALQRVPGVQSAVVDLKIHLAVVDYNPAQTKIAEFLTACRDAGFAAEEYRVEMRFPKPIKLKGG